jgi:hypothetical protein
MSKETRYRNVIHHRQYPLDVSLYTLSLEGAAFIYNCM